MGEVILKIENGTKKFKNELIFQNVSMEFEKGNSYGFVGPNGCGKSVFFKTLCGYSLLTEGQVIYRGKIIGKEQDFIDDAGIVIEEPEFINSLSGLENLKILAEIQKRSIPYIIVKNKADLTQKQDGENEIFVSAKTGENISVLKERIAALAPKREKERRIIGDLLEPNDFVVLVVPIDSAAPKGRLILPQQQTIRDILEAGAVSIVTRDFELAETLAALGKRPKLVITDSQIFGKVSKIVPEDIPLTSFSILMARYKGNLEQNVKGARALEQLKNGDTVLISEGCTHHRQCEDIGTVKLPRWIREYTGKELQFQFTSGGTFPADLSPYALIVHCGGCMLNEKEMQHRLSIAKEQGAKMTNYGICIAYIHGILERSLAPLGL